MPFEIAATKVCQCAGNDHSRAPVVYCYRTYGDSAGSVANGPTSPEVSERVCRSSQESACWTSTARGEVEGHRPRWCSAYRVSPRRPGKAVAGQRVAQSMHLRSVRSIRIARCGQGFGAVGPSRTCRPKCRRPARPDRIGKRILLSCNCRGRTWGLWTNPASVRAEHAGMHWSANRGSLPNVHGTGRWSRGRYQAARRFCNPSLRSISLPY